MKNKQEEIYNIGEMSRLSSVEEPVEFASSICAETMSSATTSSKAPKSAWDHNMLGGAHHTLGDSEAISQTSTIETATKLYISNLGYGVTNADITELFSVFDRNKYLVHYESGISKGMAVVVFSRRQDALSAMRMYNNVLFHGKPMKIEIVGTNT